MYGMARLLRYENVGSCRDFSPLSQPSIRLHPPKLLLALADRVMFGLRTARKRLVDRIDLPSAVVAAAPASAPIGVWAVGRCVLTACVSLAHAVSLAAG
jgi:hypothetical protein